MTEQQIKNAIKFRIEWWFEKYRKEREARNEKVTRDSKRTKSTKRAV